MGPSPKRFRYHLILGDGHRSQFNLALQLGATALAIKSVLYDEQLERQVAAIRGEFGAEWVPALRRLNVLAASGGKLQIHPLVPRTQRLYLEAARRFAATLADPPSWIPRLLADWERTLVAFEQLDRVWLARHLDAFAKYELFSAVLAENHCPWSLLPQRQPLFHELALLDQNYHEFCNPRSAFAQLEQAGLLDHRVVDPIEPGKEADPYVPEAETRAQPRARFIRDQRGNTDCVVDWSYIQDVRQNRVLRFYDPFTRELGEWVQLPSADPRTPLQSHEQAILGEVALAFDQGRYEEAHHRLARSEIDFRMLGHQLTPELLRYRARLLARRGQSGGGRLLERMFAGQPLGLRELTDFLYVYCFRGLLPDIDRMGPYIRQGQDLLATEELNFEPDQIGAFCENAAAGLIRHGRLDEAQSLLERITNSLYYICLSDRVQAQLMALQAELYRRRGDRRRAIRSLHEARRLQQDEGWLGDLAFSTCLTLAKYERRTSRALSWINQAKEIPDPQPGPPRPDRLAAAGSPAARQPDRRRAHTAEGAGIPRASAGPGRMHVPGPGSEALGSLDHRRPAARRPRSLLGPVRRMPPWIRPDASLRIVREMAVR